MNNLYLFKEDLDLCKFLQLLLTIYKRILLDSSFNAKTYF